MASSQACRGRLAVLGAGSWGTALSLVLAGAGWRVALWARRPAVAEAIQRDRRNPAYLSQFALPDNVRATAELAGAVAGAELVVLAVPSAAMAEVCRDLASLLAPDQGLVNAAKGLEPETGRRLSQVIEGALRPRWQGPLAALSGPNLAPEVAAGLAAATTVACADAAFARRVQAALSTPRFRVYTNPDMVGVELGGALKNIIAIGAGASDGLGFGENAKAALLTRGLTEMARLGMALGARPETLRGLSGMGDLVATCAGRQSRNHRVGYELARGRRLPEILADMGQVAEGVDTTRAARRLAAEVGVEMPITEAVHALLFAAVPAAEAVRALMARAWRDELEP